MSRLLDNYQNNMHHNITNGQGGTSGHANMNAQGHLVVLQESPSKRESLEEKLDSLTKTYGVLIDSLKERIEKLEEEVEVLNREVSELQSPDYD
jgi:flagellar biosynthesis chaperone FliJ